MPLVRYRSLIKEFFRGFLSGGKRTGARAHLIPVFGKSSVFTDLTKVKIALAALGENIGNEFVKFHFQEIKTLKAKFEVKTPEAPIPTEKK